MTHESNNRSCARAARSRSITPSRALRLAAAVAGSVLPASALLGQTSGTWAVDYGTAGGSWSAPANWVGAVVPDNGGTALFTTLPSFTTAPVNIIQDLPTVTLSELTFDSFITYLIKPPAGNTTNTITLTGAAAINTNTQSINTLSATVFGHQFQIGIAGSSGLVKNGPGTATLWNSGGNSYTGGTTVNGGILVARQFGDALFGDTSGSVTFNDGTIRITTGAWTSSRTINFAGSGTIEASTTGTTTWNGQVVGSGAVNKIGSRGLNLTAANTFTGATNILAGSIGLSGNGAIASTSALTSRDALVLDNSATNVANRINDAAPVVFNGGSLNFIGNTTTGSSETLGTMTFSRGTSTIQLSGGTGQFTSLALGNVSRDTGGIVLFRGNNLGAAPGPDVTQVTFATAPTLVGGGGAAGSTNISILPWAVANTVATTGNANTFVTYGASGIRPLDATEYASSISAGVSTDNVRVSTAASVDNPSTVNSLIVTGTTVGGTATLSITSGALLSFSGASISAPLDFGSAEALIIAPGTISLSGAISGSGGLTKQGAGTATFANSTSTYTGTTTIGGGTALFGGSVPSGSPSFFGSGTSAIVLAPAGLGTGGTTARLAFNGTGSATFDRDLLVSGRIALNNAATIPGFGVSGGGSLIMNGDITLDSSPLTLLGGAGSSVIINGDITGSAGPVTDQGGASIITLNGNNTFDGGVEMSNGITWEVGSDSAFGSGLLKMVQTSGQPTIRAVGGPRTVSNETVAFSFSANYWQIAGDQPLTFTGSINLSGSYTHNINNTALTTYAGVLHTGGFNKAGTGTLLLSGNNIYTGSTTVSSGVLRVGHSNALGSVERPTVVASGAALEVSTGVLSTEPVTLSGTGVGGNGAIHNLAGNNSLGPVTLAASSTINVPAGALTTGNIDAAATTSALTKTGSAVLTAQRVRVGALDVAGGTLAIAAGRNTDKTSIVSGALTTGASSSLDLGDNDLIVDYTGATPVAQIQAQLASGYAAGSWDGPGINSSQADAATNALGYADNAVLGLSSFSGQTVDATSVLVRYTFFGDTNLDGQVDITDLGNLATNWQTANVWTGGDSDYSGFIDITDLGMLATNWQAGVPNPAGPSFNEALASLRLPQVAIPEPGLLWCSLIALATGIMRRR